MARLRFARSLALGAAASIALVVALTACAPEGGSSPSTSPSSSATGTGSPSPDTSGGASASPSPSGTPEAQIPDDCKEMLTASVLAELDGVPLNDPAFGPSGVQPDGSLICIWGDPAADTTGLRTSITHMSRGPALDLLNDLADTQGFTCYTPDGGTRCEKTWPNETYPVTDGRTLFWREDIMIDTQYSNLAPSGYTTSIVEYIWPA